MMRNIDDLKVFFESDLRQLLQPLENYRIRRVRNFKRYLYISLILLFVLILQIFTNNKLLITSTGLLIAFFIGLAYESLANTNLLLRKEYKNRILPIVLGFMFSDFEYFPRQKISKIVFEKSLLFPHEINTITGEDYMRFSIDNVELMFCESVVYGYLPRMKMFTGIFVSATFNKSFNSKTFIFPQKTTSFFRKMKFSVLGASYKVKLEDPDFDREFIVLSEDQIESRYILTPSLMLRILEYKRKLNTELAFSFNSNRLYCTIPNSKNLFEPAIFESFLDFDFISRNIEPVLLYTSIVSDLNLNVRIWSK